MLSTVNSGTVFGIGGHPVTVEAELIKGLQAFHVVGLPEVAVRESRLRVQSALRHSGFRVPQGRITINLAPAEIPKRGAMLDLAIAVSVLVASGQIPPESVEGCGFVGELSLTGELRGGRGLLPIVAMGVARGWLKSLVPSNTLSQCSLLPQESLIPVRDLRGVVQALSGVPESSIPQSSPSPAEESSLPPRLDSRIPVLDMGQVQGQEDAKRVALIAAAGRHNLLLSGPPGCGKSMIAARMPHLLPELTREEALEIQLIRSVVGDPNYRYASIWQRPFRSPHHSATQAAVLGGGAPVQPGEVSLAHGGILFLDELPEYSRGVLEALRQPLESAEVVVARVKTRVTLPANFMLVAAMNPCPCGYWGVKGYDCVCLSDEIARYRRRLSGPILDRIDLCFHMPRVGFSSFSKSEKSLTTTEMRSQLQVAQEIQRKRGQSRSEFNSACTNEALLSESLMSKPGRRLVEFAMERGGLSARGGTKLMRVARTIADLESEPLVQEKHVAEAMAYGGASAFGRREKHGGL